MSALISSVVIALTAAVGNSCAQQTAHAIETQPPAAEQQPKIVAIADLVARPEQYADQPIRVRGRLENAGANYFKDRRIVLTDGKGQSIEVRPWLPVSRPGPSSQTRTAPTLAEYLDRRVELVGSLTRRTEPNRTNEFILEVKSAKVLGA
jgi:hypothetical protein